MSQGKLVLAINAAWNIANFRAGLVRGLQADGWEVVAMAPRDEHVPRVEALGCRFVEMPMRAVGTNPWHDWQLYRRYHAALAAERPDAFLGFTIKPNVWGSLAAQRLGIPVINNIAGLGTAFIRASWLTAVARRLYRSGLRRSHRVLFQNDDDRRYFIDSGLVDAARSARVPGSGVDLVHFAATPLPLGRPLRLLFIGRLLRDKGVAELVEAARLLQARQAPVRIALLGFLDVANRSAITRDEVAAWQAAGLVDYLGSADDVRPHIAAAHAVVLPSYREGVPRTLLEAAAMGRPLIATDVVGCRDAVDDGRNGLLARVRDAGHLAAQIERFAALDDDERAAMGAASRAKVEREFDERIVVDTYRRLLQGIAGAMMQRRQALAHLGALALVAPARQVCAEGSGPALTPQDFGAVGNGEADDTRALQRLLDRARESGAEVHLTPGVYAISSYLLVRDRLRAILGRGGVIRCIGTQQNAGLLLAGVARGEAENVRGLRIEGLVIDAAHRERPVNAIHGQNCRDCRIVGNRIVNLRVGSGVLIQSPAAGGQAAADNLIADNVVEGIPGQSGTDWFGIFLNAERRFLPPAREQNEQWKSHFIAADAALPIERHLVRNNRISGGYYGIWLMATRDSLVQDNQTSQNTRGIVVADCSQDNLVSGNRCDESLSSAIHLSYGARRNRVSDNRVSGQRAGGEGLLQAYVGVEDNQFIDNQVDTTGRPQYLAYCAIHARRNEFRGNLLRGRASRAGMALESAWRWTLLNPAHYGFLKGPGNNGFAGAGSADNAFIGNVIECAGDAPAIFLAQVGGVETSLSGTVLKGNRIAGDRDQRQIELVEESAGQLRGLRLTGNRFVSGAQARQFVLPRGPDHCSEARDNGPLDELVGPGR